MRQSLADDLFDGDTTDDDVNSHQMVWKFAAIICTHGDFSEKGQVRTSVGFVARPT